MKLKWDGGGGGQWGSTQMHIHANMFVEVGGALHVTTTPTSSGISRLSFCTEWMQEGETQKKKLEIKTRHGRINQRVGEKQPRRQRVEGKVDQLDGNQSKGFKRSSIFQRSSLLIDHGRIGGGQHTGMLAKSIVSLKLGSRLARG